MRLSVIQIGNSKGVRIPKPILEQCAIGEEVELSVKGKALVLEPIEEGRIAMSLNFNKLSEMKDKDVQELLRKVSAVELCIALIDAPDAAKTKVYENMSVKAVDLIQKEVRRLGSLPARELLIEMQRARFGHTFS